MPAQVFDDIAPPAPDNNEDEIVKQQNYSRLNLYQLKKFPFQRVYKCNPNLYKIHVSNSFQLTNLAKELKKIRSLKTLSLSSVGFTEFPIVIYELHSLQELSYGNNIEKLPAENGQLCHFEIAFLYKINLKELPKEIGQLDSLKQHSLLDNSLKKLPDDLGELRNLKVLMLSHNPGLSSLPESLVNLKLIKLFDVRNTSISESGLKNLQQQFPDTEILY